MPHHSFARGPHVTPQGNQQVLPPDVTGRFPVLAALALANPCLVDRAADLLQQPVLHGLDTPHSFASEVHPALLMAAVAHKHMSRAEHGLPDCVSLTPAALDDIKSRLQLPFTVDCSALSLPTVPHACETVLPNTQAVLNANLAGQTVYMHAHTSIMPDLIRHYLKCKAAAPELDTKGVFVVSHFLFTRHPELFASMHKLQTYSKHMPVNLRHWAGKPPVLSRTLTPLHVLYDGALTPSMKGMISSTDQPLEEVPSAVLHPSQVCMTFTGLVSGNSGTVGLDSYAQGMGYISPSFV